jgi:hypothetical protein
MTVRPALYPVGMDQVREIVFGVGEDEGGVAYFVGAVRTHRRFFRGREICGNLRGVHGGSTAGQADEVLIEMIEPLAQHLRRVAVGIGGNKNYFELIFGIGRQFLECSSDHGHLQRAHVRTMRVAEEEQRYVTLSFG